MRPIRLRLQGLTRYRDPVDLDLSAVPPGLVAIVGPNGAGKSTLLEAMGPLPLYLELPSYPGKLTDAALRTVRDGYVDVTIEHRGTTYRHVVQFDPQAGGGRGKVEAFLFAGDVDTGTAGRQGDYLQAVGKVYSPRPVFLAAAFATQTHVGDWFGMDRVERRDLFATLLGLGDLQRLAERATTHRKRCDATGAELEAAVRAVHEVLAATPATDDVVGLEAELHRAGAELEAARDRAAARAADHRGAEQALHTIETEIARHRQAVEAVRREVNDRGVEVRRLEGEVARLQGLVDRLPELEANAATRRRLEAELAAARESFRTAKTELAAANEAVLAARREHVRASDEVSRLHDVASSTRRGNVVAELQRLDALATELARLPAAVDEADTWVEAGNRVTAARRAVSTAEAALVTARASAEADDRTAALLETVPCGGRTLTDADQRSVDCGTCGLIGAAIAAGMRQRRWATDQADLEAAVVAAGLELAAAQEAAAQAEAARVVRDRRRDLEAQLRSREEWAQSLRAIDEATAALPPAQLSLAAATREVEAVGQRLNTAMAALADARAAGDAKAAELAAVPVDLDLDAARTAGAALEARAEQLAGARELLTAAATRRDTMPPEPDPGQARATVQRARQALDEVEVVVRDRQHQRDAAQAALATARARRETRDQAEQQLAELQRRRVVVDQRRNGWVLLERGLGRDGIQALEIDAAGPEVSEILNELLHTVFGGRFTAALRTVQEAGAGRVQREVFDLQILDGERGTDARDASRYSVGERALISEALKLSLAIFNARRSPALDTLWRDECDGALEERLAPLYPVMLRRALELGGWRNVYLISHRESVWGQADAVIRVEGGRAWLE